MTETAPTIRMLLARPAVLLGHVDPGPNESCDWHVLRARLWLLVRRWRMRDPQRSVQALEMARLVCPGTTPLRVAALLVED